jgi:tetratricopeptide (TPR) repeat protein
MVTVALVLVGTTRLLAQGPQSAQQLFESGQYDAAIQAIAREREGGSSDASQAFLAGQILLKLDRTDAAKDEFQRLAQSDNETWQRIGRSAAPLADRNVEPALQSAREAVSSSPESFEAQYQLGLAHANRESWAEAAEAFARASSSNPAFAYAHYYAGLSYSRIQRADKTAEHFERFLKLAPRAPERPAVENIMRTLRGR